MAAVNNEPLQKVLANYNIKVLSIRNESYKDKKGVWWVHTPIGYKILKKMSNSEETLKFLIAAVRHLTSKGVLIPEINRTMENSDYVNLDGNCFILSDAAEGKNPSYDIPEQLSLVVKSLARFHAASAGFSPPQGSKQKYHLGTWIVDYEQQIEDMNRFYEEEVHSGENNTVGTIIIKEFPYFYNRAKNAITGLQGKEYRDWVEKAEKTGCLCHQDFAAGNLLMASNNRLFVLDTDSLTVDIPARDIRKLLNKVMKKFGKWDVEKAKTILSFYHSENPLLPDQWQVVKYDLMFPHLFLGAMNKYYYQRDKDWTQAKYLERLRETSSFEKTIEPVLEQFEGIVPQ